MLLADYSVVNVVITPRHKLKRQDTPVKSTYFGKFSRDRVEDLLVVTGKGG